MSKEEKLVLAQPQGPVVNLRRIRRIDTYEIMESELEELNDVTERESLFLGFFSVCLGGALSAILSLATASWDSPVLFAVVVAIAAVLIIASMVLGGLWWQVRKQRPRLIERVKRRAGMIEQEIRGVVSEA